MIYSTKEKLGHYNKLRAGESRLDADYTLLKELNPKHPLILKPLARGEKYANEILLALLDISAACDITAFRREWVRKQKHEADRKAFVDTYNSNIDLLLTKYKDQDSFQTADEVKDMFVTLGLPEPLHTGENPLTYDQLVGILFKDLCFLQKLDLDEINDISEKAIQEAVTSSFSSLVRKYNVLPDQDIDKTEESESENLNDDSFDKGEQAGDLQKKEIELEDREAELDERESELNDKEADLQEKEDILEEQVAKEKKSEPKKKNIRKFNG